MDLKSKLHMWQTSKQNALASTTLRAASAQIMKYGDHLSPPALWSALSNLRPYSRTVTFGRLADFHAFHGDVSFKDWRKANALLFKNTYAFKAVGVDYAEALRRIATLDPETRGRAMQIIKSAQRYSESTQNTMEVVGKGGKRRPAYAPYSPYSKSYSSFLRALKQIGLRPHDLRKLAVTYAASKGAGPADLCQVAGWSSITTAYRYLQPKQDDILRGYLE